MSEYHVAEVTFKDENVLKSALEDMGYTVDVHEEPVAIEGYNDSRVGSCHLVVKRNQFGGYGDVGFEKTADGFRMHADSDDIQGDQHAKFQLPTLNKKYIEEKLKKHVSKTSACQITSRTEKKNGQVEIHLRVR
jgi:hypothetical protein